MSRIFISHNHKDKETTDLLVDLLYKSLKGLKAQDMFISSHEKYHLAGGTNYNKAIKEAILKSEGVIGFISESSKKSGYVLCELGAAWAVNKWIIPLFIHGSGIQPLPGPLRGLHALSCDNPIQIENMIKDIGERLHLKILNPLNKKVELFCIKAPFLNSFWANLSDRVSIIHGVRNSIPDKKDTTISSLDFESSHLLYEFLLLRFPSKKIRIISSSNLSNRELRDDSLGDLIVVGGPAVNKVFSHAEVENYFRLKMGRICQIKGQKVFHVSFHSGSIPQREFPILINDHYSSDVFRDYGLITCKETPTFGGTRKIIGIGGIKGNGTKAAVEFITKEGPLNFCQTGTSKELPNLGKAKNLQMVVGASVSNNILSKIELAGLFIDGKQMIQFPKRSNYSEKCELERKCRDCSFGVPHPIKAIVFDLDDTLIDTYQYLIKPLESEAAKKIQDAGLYRSREELTKHLLKLRKSDPTKIDIRILEKGVNTSKRKQQKAINLRNSVFKKACPTKLGLNDKVKAMLSFFKEQHLTFLLTSGPFSFQNQKIQQLGLESLFYEVKILDPKKTSITKKIYLQDILSKFGYINSSVLVVGNRLDDEIKAAVDLGMKSVWIKRGEGSELSEEDQKVTPSFTLSNIMQLPSILKQPEFNLDI